MSLHECMQIAIVELLQRDRGQVTVVGDDAQSIYGFRGADHTAFQRFQDIFEQPGESIRRPLTVNYRCFLQLAYPENCTLIELSSTPWKSHDTYCRDKLMLCSY